MVDKLIQSYNTKQDLLRAVGMNNPGLPVEVVFSMSVHAIMN
jgi:hypothetical protein